MKRAIFQVDATKKDQVKKYLDLNGITWSDETRFRFDIRTAIVTAATTALAILLLV